MRRLSRQKCRLAGGCSWVLSQEPSGIRGGDRDARGASRVPHMADQSGCLRRAVRICPQEAYCRRNSGGPADGEAKLHSSRSRAPRFWRAGKYALFVGRLSEEKGLRGLLSAWKRLAEPIPLFLLGEGPMRDEIAPQLQACGLRPESLLGNVPREEVLRWMRGARFLVCPSHWFEGCPLVIVEAFACGIPVIATGHGPTAKWWTINAPDCMCVRRTMWISLRRWHGRGRILPKCSLWAKPRGASSSENIPAEGNYAQLIALYRRLAERKELGSGAGNLDLQATDFVSPAADLDSPPAPAFSDSVPNRRAS